MKNTFVTLPENMANSFVQYLRARVAHLQTQSAMAGNDGAIDEALALRALALSFRQVEAMVMTDNERSKAIAEVDPGSVDENGPSVVNFSEEAASE